MDAPAFTDPEETRFVTHLNHVGYALDSESDPNGWRLATNPMAMPLCFRVVGPLICLYARYPAGGWHGEAYNDLLQHVNAINSSHWLVRCTAMQCEGPAGDELCVTLEANLPAYLPTQELGACLFKWIAESGHIERTTRGYVSRSDDGVTATGQRSEPGA